MIAGIIWLWTKGEHVNALSFCLPSLLFRVPCPACGTTRSMLHIYHGEWTSALWSNPLGFIVVAIGVLSLLMFFYDMIMHRTLLYTAYKRFFFWLGKPWIYIPLIVFTLANWIWNLYKYM